METKVCTKCGQEKPMTIEFFRPDSRYACGFRGVCRECFGEYCRTYNKVKRTNKYQKKTDRMYLSKHTIKELGEEAANKIKEERIEAYKERDRLRYADPKRKDEIKEYRKTSQYKLMKSMADKKYKSKLATRQKIVFYNQRRKSIKRCLPCCFADEQWEECKEYFNNTCAYCGNSGKLTQDHFVPIISGGEYTKNNIVPACSSCNSSKSDNYYFEWYPKQPFYSKKRHNRIMKYLNYKGEVQQLALII